MQKRDYLETDRIGSGSEGGWGMGDGLGQFPPPATFSAVYDMHFFS